MEVDVGEEFGQFQRFVIPAFNMDWMEIAFLSYSVDNKSRVTKDV